MDGRDTWRRSSRSGANNDCVEIARVPGGRAVRDSKLGGTSPVLSFAGGSFGAFLARCKEGAFDR